MENETTSPSPVCCGKKCGSWNKHGSTNCAYGLAFIGAAIYYIQQSDTFWMGAVGVLKALVWPAYIVYEAMKFLKM